MPLVMVRPLDVENERIVIDIDSLKIPYPQFVKDGTKVRCLINRIFIADTGKVVSQPRAMRIFDIFKPTYGSPKLDISSYALPEGIPKGYYVEVLAINFVYEKIGEGEKQRTTEFPIYPGETRDDIPPSIPYQIRNEIKGGIEALRKVGEDFETIGSLHQAGLYEVAVDLAEGLLRVERNDHEGAVKFLRKVVEGLHQYIDGKVIGSANRTEEIGRFLKTSYSLMSNFGEHTGTHGWIDESLLSKEIAVSISRYILKTLKK